MIIHNIDSWEDLRTKLYSTKKRNIGSGFTLANFKLYRGQKDISWKLSSKLERNLNTNKINPHYYNIIKDKILNQFKDNLMAISSEYANITDTEALIIGRHHGLITPVLDWTSNPLKALFFALEDIYKLCEFRNLNTFSTEPFAIYKLNVFPDLLVRNEFEIIKTTNQIGSRMHAQSAYLTELKINSFDNIEDYLASKEENDFLEKFIIDKNLIFKILSILDETEINGFSLYPDITGAALQANIDLDTIKTFS